jgi:hypothetical protein
LQAHVVSTSPAESQDKRFGVDASGQPDEEKGARSMTTFDTTWTTPPKDQVLRKKNDLVRLLTHTGSSELLAFFCECGQEGCLSPAWRTAAEYDAALELGEPMLAPGH